LIFPTFRAKTREGALLVIPQRAKSAPRLTVDIQGQQHVRGDKPGLIVLQAHDTDVYSGAIRGGEGEGREDCGGAAPALQTKNRDEPLKGLDRGS
jgi:hypothetical protein